MKILLTLDYEVFFGHNSGSIEGCLISPTQKIIEILDKHNVKATFFVDAGYVERIKHQCSFYPELKNEYEKLVKHISLLSQNGHDIQLHIHPHWRDSYYSEKGWIIDTKRYRLHNFSTLETNRIVRDYKKILEDIIKDQIFVFRAGGWCLQPFESLGSALFSNGIRIDSTLYKGGYYKSSTHFFDFRNAEDKTIWKFKDDPNKENEEGEFIEMPISSIKVNPTFYWKMVFTKKFGGKKHKAIGDGKAVKGGKSSIIRMLTKPTMTVASIDGYKSSLLNKALNLYKTIYTEEDYFIVIGHPKATTPYSLKKLDEFIRKSVKQNEYTTYRQEVKNDKLSISNV